MHVNIERRAHVPDEHLLQVKHPKLRQIYAARGIESAEQLDKRATALLHYDQLKGVQAAIRILAHAIEHQHKIMIIGDFDADGATSTALMCIALAQLGSKNHDYLVPNRFDFGYGLSPEIVTVAHQQNAQVIITVDNGIACIAGVEKAKELGIQVVVTDHHLPGHALPIADAIVNPNQVGCEFPSKNLAGVGVAFYVMLALRAYLKEHDWFEKTGIAIPNLAQLLDIVALGTVADVVPLDDNNRVLVHQGLQRIRSNKCRPGINAMLDVAGRNSTRLVASDLGFVLGPRLNAAGRLEDMSLGIECLLTQDEDEARRIAFRLDSLNQQRREIESDMQQQALNVLQQLNLSEQELPYGIVLYQQDFHQGVIGILAGRIKDKYHRPTIAFALQNENTVKGSARSISGLHIRDLLEEVNVRFPGTISKFGGHAMAAGLTLSLEKLPEFSKAFEQLTAEKLADQPIQGNVASDGELPAQDLTLNFAQLLKESGPWGQQFPEPIFDDEFELVEQRLVGAKHLKIIVKHASGKLLDGIAFNVDLETWPNPHTSYVHLAYKLDVNEFRGRVNLQLMVEGLLAK